MKKIMVSLLCVFALLFTACTRNHASQDPEVRYYFFTGDARSMVRHTKNQIHFANGQKEIYTLMLSNFKPQGELFKRYNDMFPDSPDRFISITKDTRFYRKAGDDKVKVLPDAINQELEQGKTCPVGFWVTVVGTDLPKGVSGGNDWLVADEVDILHQ